MGIAYLVLGFSALFFGITVITAFLWAHRTGHFKNLDETAASIFDDEDTGDTR
ncbi:MAG TPA: cbb3-type cytochrome oxidase assembly protein CcoS [Bdellovibrionota bacterium]|nr:cbb3-type cytochrome oxidase assembly protein CcoS [Bdellovibrionota bacterium]